ncbi:MAG TPA: glycosyltransferase family 4 protein, partial [Myxococcota bacterium]
RADPPARVAFLTSEFVSEDPRGGGLGHYVSRMARALVAAGHQAEVFVPSARDPGPLDFDGIVVHRVRRALERRAVRAALLACRRLGLRRLARCIPNATDAWLLARALRQREALAPFDLVQSADHLAAGLFVDAWGGRRRRPHAVRCSNDGDWIAQLTGADARAGAWLHALERHCLRRADTAYAPSRFLAEHYAARHGIRLAVIRPPAVLEAQANAALPPGLPKRYFVHFGQLSAAKGTPVLAEALLRVWAREPDFAMVWAGRDRGFGLSDAARRWGEHREQVHWLGELTGAELCAVLEHAEAAVLPSRFDNLPNTVIESLLHGLPVIGTRGASIDELVEPGVHGELVAHDDAQALADAMLRLWRGESPVRKGFRWQGPLAESMRPECAVASLLTLARRRREPA